MDNKQRSRHTPGTGVRTPVDKPRRGPGRPTRDQTMQRNEELLDIALDLFLEKGFERTTIDAITASVGMAKRTVYQRYHDKTALFKAALQRAIEEWIVPVERLHAAETENLEESLLRIGQILVENIMSPAGLRLMRITNAESGRLPEIGVYALKQGTDRTVAYLADLFRRRIKPRGVEIIDPEEAAMGFLYLVVGGPASATAWGMVLEKTQIDKHTTDCVRLFLRGLLPRESGGGTSSGVEARRPRNGEERLPSQPATHAIMSAAESQKVKALEDENRRLKVLLAESTLSLADYRDQERRQRR